MRFVCEVGFAPHRGSSPPRELVTWWPEEEEDFNCFVRSNVAGKICVPEVKLDYL